jgi:hypothetical protein
MTRHACRALAIQSRAVKLSRGGGQCYRAKRGPHVRPPFYIAKAIDLRFLPFHEQS